MALGGFIEEEPSRLSGDPDIPGRGAKKEKPKERVQSKNKKKKSITRRSQVSLLLSEEEYDQVFQMAEDSEISMTKIVRRFLSDKGFFND